MRRAALAAFPREAAAGLHGAAWLAFLDRAAPRPGFAAGPAAPYARPPASGGAAVSMPGIAEAAAQWVRVHRAPASAAPATAPPAHIRAVAPEPER
ncbi:MAG: DUF4381 domain-containing protein [Pseudomonadota bacterium]|nr:DUF4381 domain-containing protein [Pseudomonadota bacterium]